MPKNWLQSRQDENWEFLGKNLWDGLEPQYYNLKKEQV